jgi:hypothetical protein
MIALEIWSVVGIGFTTEAQRAQRPTEKTTKVFAVLCGCSLWLFSVPSVPLW